MPRGICQIIPWSPARGIGEVADPLSEIQSTEEVSVCPKISEHGRLQQLRQTAFISDNVLISVCKPGTGLLSYVVNAPEEQPIGICYDHSHL